MPDDAVPIPPPRGPFCGSADTRERTSSKNTQHACSSVSSRSNSALDTTCLHFFFIGEKRYGEPDPDGHEVIKRDKHALLSAVVLTEGMHFRYKYDFGGGWSHDITVEKIERLDSIDWITPRCVDGQRAAPLEDCGGIEGYTKLIDALYDPVHPEHTQLRTWAGP